MRTATPLAAMTVLTAALVASTPVSVTSAASTIAPACLGDYGIASSTGAAEIPDGVPGGITLEPLTTGTTGVLTDVVVSVSLTHSYAGDLSLVLGYDADRDGVADAEAPLGMYMARRDACEGPEGYCPVELSGRYLLTDDGWGTPGTDAPLDAFRGLRAGGTWTLTIADADADDTGTVDGWAVYTASEQQAWVVQAGAPSKGAPVGFCTGTCR